MEQVCFKLLRLSPEKQGKATGERFPRAKWDRRKTTGEGWPVIRDLGSPEASTSLDKLWGLLPKSPIQGKEQDILSNS